MTTVKVFNPHKTKAWDAFLLVTYGGRQYVEHPIYGDEASICVVNPDKTITETGFYDISDIYEYSDEAAMFGRNGHKQFM